MSSKVQPTHVRRILLFNFIKWIVVVLVNNCMVTLVNILHKWKTYLKHVIWLLDCLWPKKSFRFLDWNSKSVFRNSECAKKLKIPKKTFKETDDTILSKFLIGFWGGCLNRGSHQNGEFHVVVGGHVFCRLNGLAGRFFRISCPVTSTKLAITTVSELSDVVWNLPKINLRKSRN